ncbi:MAG: cytochrome b561, partial [Enterobacterales bacterium]
MGIKNTTEGYGSIAIAIHWLMAIIIITLLAVGFTMTGLEDGDEKWKIYAIHKATGLIILGLALFRWYWVLSNDKPKPLANWSKADVAISHATKWLLMLMMVVMPVAGIMQSLAGGHDIGFFGLFTIEGFAEKNEQLQHLFHEVHEYGGLILVIIIGLHVLAALKHHLLN